MKVPGCLHISKNDPLKESPERKRTLQPFIASVNKNYGLSTKTAFLQYLLNRKVLQSVSVILVAVQGYDSDFFHAGSSINSEAVVLFRRLFPDPSGHSKSHNTNKATVPSHRMS